ncbi:hypothetical protein [Ponticoccus alexandrii]|uniref:DUF2147 domain-containing protein n=1 Tax=Ponticoccus alexandrii TaxID=1943633 RepID=A0ABX7F6R2_9RHOB|nr:hypothetical protein [Ponticoccus alexandrii]ETA50438.1 hypothetical protein P279_19555 [Rhodobacteraceae bacterium PD-2]QRF66200.1 hypothetical protein GQA70_07720 [Ponticoccus alexandrii]
MTIAPGRTYGGASLALVAGLLAGEAAAMETWSCQLQGDCGALDLRMVLDPAVLSDPVASGEPQRRWTAQVTMVDDRFDAEALLTDDGWRGFHRGAEGLMLTKAPDGTARLTRGAVEWTGRCEET